MTPTMLHAPRARRPARAFGPAPAIAEPPAPSPAPEPPSVADALAEAERRAVAAERDLAYLALDTSSSMQAARMRVDALTCDLDRISAESERRGTLLGALRGQLARVTGRIPAIEQAARGAVARAERERDELAARLREREQDLEAAEHATAGLCAQRRVHELVAAQLAEERERLALVCAKVKQERASADARVREMHEQAAAAIRSAEERATVALCAARERIRETAEPSTVERGLRAELERERHEHDELERRLLAQLDGMQHASQLSEGRLTAELERLRHEKAALESRLRDELDATTDERIELRTRLGVAEHTLLDRDRDLERERRLADEAVRWASRVEREIVLGQQDVPAARAIDGGLACDSDGALEPDIAALRRRGPRVRLRRAS